MRTLFGALLIALAAPVFAQAPVRPPEDVARDAARKPADMVAFAGIKPGSMVADMIPGTGYFTRIFAAAVGPTGHVTAIIPEKLEADYPGPAKAVRALSATGYPNVSVVAHVTDPSLLGKLDVFWTAQNYHDLHNNMTPDAVVGFDKAVFETLKHGGVFVVVDHVAVAGSGLTATKPLHRIDPAVVKAEAIAAGFVFDGESNVLANPADPHTAIVFDPSIRGKTDQFAYRFRKP